MGPVLKMPVLCHEASGVSQGVGLAMGSQEEEPRTPPHQGSHWPMQPGPAGKASYCPVEA